MNKSIRSRVLVSFAMVLVAAVAVSQTVKHQGRGEEGPFGSHMLHFMTDYLDLNDAQQAQVKDILDKEQPTAQPLLDQLKQSHQQLQQLAQATPFDEGKVRSLATQQAQTMADLIVEHARIESQIFQILTPEQKTKAQKFMGRHMGGGFMHHGGPPE